MEEHLSSEVLSLHSKMSKWLKYFLLGLLAVLVTVSTAFLIDSYGVKSKNFGYKEVDTSYTNLELPPPLEPYATVEKNDYEFPRWG